MRARPSRRRRSRLKVGYLLSVFSLVDLPFGDPLPTFLFLFVAFRPTGRLGEFNNPGPSRADGLQLLTIGVGGVAGRRT
jgi:hypothetical protein